MAANRRLCVALILLTAAGAAGCAATAGTVPANQPARTARTDAPPPAVPQEPGQAFLAGYKAFRSGDFAFAAESLDFAADRDSDLADYALYYLGLSDEALDRDAEAESALGRMVDSYPQSVWVEHAELAIAAIDLKTGRPADASALASRIVGGTANHEVEQDARLTLARALESLGDPRGAYQQLETIRNQYPRGEADSRARAQERSLLAAHPEIVEVNTLDYRRAEAELLLIEGQAGGALEQIDAALLLAPSPVMVAELKWIEARAALHRDPPRAKSAMITYLAIAPRGPASPAVLDKLARLAWNANDTDQARGWFRRLAREFPESEQAPDAMFAIGRTFEDDGDLDSARAQYERTYARYPHREIAAESRFRAAFTLYMGGEYQSAARRFGAIDPRLADGSQRDMTLYWQARALEKSGETEPARAIYQRLAISIDSNYYPALAAARVSIRPQAFPAALVSEPSGEPPPTLAGDAGFHLVHVMALRTLELKALETAELKALEEHAQEIPALRGFVLAAYRDADAWHDALTASVRMEQRGEISRELAERLRYPRAYWDLIDSAARDRGLDPYLLLALARQESLFDPTARSSSDARGLMQLMAATAQRVSGTPRDEQDLYDPTTSVRLGSSYLKQLFEMYGGDQIRAVAAYNAGEHAVANWNAKFPGDDDQWVENIGYHETRDYVKKVIGGLREYQLIYATPSGGAPALDK